MQTPYILTERYPTGNTTVITVDCADFAIDPTGQKDSAPAITEALGTAAQAGGGIVYLPEGRYRLDSPITIPTAVTLRGEWLSPEDDENDLRLGTILCLYAGKNDPEGTAAISMQACSGLKCLTLYYPDQTFTAPVPYAPTVRQCGVDSMTLENVTMVNPWRGVQCGPDANELHFLKNVYITPMDVGFFMDMTTDIGRMQNLHIAPAYLTRFLPETDLDALRSYMLFHVTGVYMARSDWEYGYSIHMSWCQTGFLITSFTDSGPNTQLSGLRMYNCDTGFHLIDVNPYGVALSDSEIVCDIPLTAAIRADTRFKTVMQVNGCKLAGPYETMVEQKGSGQISFANGTITGWRGEAVRMHSGGLSFLQCTFGAGDTHFSLSEEISGIQILGCTFAGREPVMQAGVVARENMQIDHTPLALPVASTGGYEPARTATVPGACLLYNVMDFGAVPDGKEPEKATDNTFAFAKALEAAGKTGGIVWVPAGLYVLQGKLHVPSGVQLRGVFEVPCHTMGGGSVLLTTSGAGDEHGNPFITIAENAGLWGLSICHPNQNPKEPIPYPWTVQSRGKNCYIVNTVLVNPWLGVDFGTYPSEGHYVSYISGAPIRCGLFCGNNSGDGWVENIQYNPHYYFRSSLPAKIVGDWKDFWHNQIRYLQALVFGYNEREHLLGTFVFAANHGLKFVMQDGKGTTGKFIGHGTDGGQNGLQVVGCEDIELINTQLVTIEAPTDRIYFQTEKDAPGKVRVHNTLMWGAPFFAVTIHGGDIEFVQTNIVDAGEVALSVDGGKVRFAGTYFYRNTGNVRVDGDGDCTLVGSMTKRRAPDRADCRIVLEMDIRQGNYTEMNSFSK